MQLPPPTYPAPPSPPGLPAFPTVPPRLVHTLTGILSPCSAPPLVHACMQSLCLPPPLVHSEPLYSPFLPAPCPLPHIARHAEPEWALQDAGRGGRRLCARRGSGGHAACTTGPGSRRSVGHDLAKHSELDQPGQADTWADTRVTDF